MELLELHAARNILFSRLLEELVQGGIREFSRIDSASEVERNVVHQESNREKIS